MIQSDFPRAFARDNVRARGVELEIEIVAERIVARLITKVIVACSVRSRIMVSLVAGGTPNKIRISRRSHVEPARRVVMIHEVAHLRVEDSSHERMRIARYAS